MRVYTAEGTPENLMEQETGVEKHIRLHSTVTKWAASVLLSHKVNFSMYINTYSCVFRLQNIFQKLL